MPDARNTAFLRRAPCMFLVMTPDGEGMSFDRSVTAAMMELALVDRGDWESTIQHILRLEARMLDVERVSFWTRRDEHEENAFVCEMAYQRATELFERGALLPVTEHADFLGAIRKSAPLAIDDCRSDPRVQSLRDYLDAREIRSLLDCPIWAHGQLVGLLCLEQVGQPRRWSASDEHFAAAVAQAATAAVEARACTEAQETARRAAFLDQSSRILGETLEIGEVARRAIALVVPSFADGVNIDLVEEGVIRNLAIDYATPEGRALLQGAMPRQPFPRGGGPYVAEHVITRGGSVLVVDITDEAFVQATLCPARPEVISACRALGARSLIAVPLFVGVRIVGVIMFVTATRRYGNDDLRLAEEFAPRVAAALENARLHLRAQAAAQRAEAALRARDELIALAGHELRTPLTALQLTAQNLVRRSPNEEVERIAGSIVGQLERLQRLSEQMLDATRISAKEFPLARTPTDLAELARGTAQTFAERLRRQGSALVVRADAPVTGEWDATQLRRMLSNLLDNAAKFGAGKPVEVDVQREGKDATLSVRDHGLGIAPDRIAGIFGAFERAVSADHFGGLGLGLFISRAIVERHGGTLTVESRPGEGAMFTARLPLKPPPPAL